MKPGEKRLVIELDANIILAMKHAAIDNNMTLKNWVMMVVAKALNEEGDLKNEK